MVVKLNLNDDGLRKFKEFFEELWERGAEFTTADVDHAEAARRERERQTTSTAFSSSTSRAAVCCRRQVAIPRPCRLILAQDHRQRWHPQKHWR